jgi:hypothetical protein
MSQVLGASVPLEALQLQMIANGTTTASGSTYDLDLGDDTVFQVNLQSGSSITLDATSPHKLNLAAGLYQINFTLWLQTTNSIYGLSDTHIQVSTDPTFTSTDVLFDRTHFWFGNGSSPNAAVIQDNNHSFTFNTTTSTTLYFRIKNTNAASQSFYVRASATDALSTIDVVRLGGALA